MRGKHTPGPWTAEEGRIRPCHNAPVYAMRDTQRVLVAEASDQNNYDLDAEVEANARLIAAAPELLAAGEALANEIGFRIDDPRCKLLDNLRAAIAKAKGE